MDTLPARRYLTVLIHVLSWWLFISGFILFEPLSRQTPMPREWWIKQSSLVLPLIALFYLNARVWVPRYVLRGRLGTYLLVCLGAVAGMWLIHRLADSWLDMPTVMHQFFNPGRAPSLKPKSHRIWDTFVILTSLFVIGISTSLTAIQRGQQDARARQSLEQEKISSELSLLKAQINPHFFFNTLNNIYALTLIDGELARDAIHRLSRLMRYVLYETGSGTVRLSQEVAFIQDYIQLMQLRLTDKVRVTFTAPTSPAEVPIAPMLILPFVENAFKHGVSATQPSEIALEMHLTGTRLDVQVRNSVFAETSASLDEGSGIGLTNTRRRLDLLYPGRHTLTVRELDSTYHVHLTLELA